MRRREFLTVSAASAAVAAVRPSGAAAAALAGAPPAATGLSRERFRSWLHQEFHLTASDALRGSRATLVAVEDGPANAGLDQFSVVFRGATTLPKGLTWLSRGDGTQFVLHLNGMSGSPERRAHFSLLETHHG